MIDTILFDWDGTLIDSAEEAFNAFRKACADLGISLDLEIYNRIYSPNWYHMYEQLGLPRNQWEEADNLWLHHYDWNDCRLLPEGRITLEEFARRNYALGIVTSGSRSRVEREIASLDLTGIFRAVVCGDEVVNKKPHPEGLEIAMQRMQKRPEHCCYVGDCPEDIEMGKRANVTTIGIPSRYPASRKLADSHPHHTFHSLDEFRKALGACPQ